MGAESNPGETTGLFMRRSGAKACARAGWALARAQRWGRWGGPAAVACYVEEAASESPFAIGLGAGVAGQEVLQRECLVRAMPEGDVADDRVEALRLALAQSLKDAGSLRRPHVPRLRHAVRGGGAGVRLRRLQRHGAPSGLGGAGPRQNPRARLLAPGRRV